ncbi:MAG: NAD-dependent epimerase/dehydratase [Pseudonocardiales bacterium]|nr:NAD-dependent epimerase/dehydratase [Pseudonocardiales bacterium]
MKIIVIGGTGLIGSALVANLRGQGHDVNAASPSSGVNTLTGEGLAGAVAGAQVVVDVANSPSFAAEDVLAFFQTAGANLHQAELDAGVGHHIALSIVGADRNTDSGYMRAKVAQEQIIQAGDIPYTIVRCTQFHEFLRAIAATSVVDGAIHLTQASMQPIAASEVSAILAEIAVSPPRNATIEIGGPERRGLDDLVRTVLAADGDTRRVVTDPAARYFGELLNDASLTTSDGARLGRLTVEQWLAAN